MPFSCVIWDCDGCLVDSEILACGTSAEVMTAYGYPITTESFIDRFAGRFWRENRKELLAERGEAFVDGMPLDEIDRRTAAAFERELQAIPFVAEAVRAMGLPVAVASGSELARIEQSLKLTGLWELFAPHVYSASEVAQGKPAPDIFLHAAQKLGAAPAESLVIEDGIAGIQAAKAAGMKVIAFLGASHITPTLRARILAQNPDAAVNDLRELAGAAEKLL